MRRGFLRAISRWSRSPGCCGFRGVLGGADFFSCFFYEFAFSNSYIQSSQRRLGEGAPTASQSAHRELARTYPHQVCRLVCSHLRNTSSMASSVDQYSSSARPKPARSLRRFQHKFSKFRERRSPMLARQNTTAGVRKRDIEACVLTPSIPAGRCVGVFCG